MKYLATMLLAMSLMACATKLKDIKAKENYADKLIVFGSGGGFTGKYITYELHPDGKLFLVKSLPSKVEESILLITLSTIQTNNLFKELCKSSIRTEAFNKPDNMSYFLILKEGEKEYNITWGGPHHPSLPIEDFYKQLNNLITTK